MIMAYLDTPSAYVVARQIGVSQQTVTRCLERATELGVLAALDDRPRAGRDAVITREARAFDPQGPISRPARACARAAEAIAPAHSSRTAATGPSAGKRIGGDDRRTSLAFLALPRQFSPRSA
jgi:hypothetical protein